MKTITKKRNNVLECLNVKNYVLQKKKKITSSLKIEKSLKNVTKTKLNTDINYDKIYITRKFV